MKKEKSKNIFIILYLLLILVVSQITAEIPSIEKRVDKLLLNTDKQVSHFDSLITNTSSDSLKLEYIFEMYNTTCVTCNMEPEKLLAYNNTALEIAGKYGLKDRLPFVNYQLGSVYFSFAKHDKAIEYFKLSIKEAEELGNDSLIVDSQLEIALLLLRRLYKPEEALNYINLALEESNSINYKYGIGWAKRLLGEYYFDKDEHKKALEYFFESSKILEEANLKIPLAVVYFRIARMHFILEEYETAYSYWEKGLAIGLEMGQLRLSANALLRLAEIHSKRNEFTESLQYKKLALNIREHINVKEGVAQVITSIGADYYKLDKYDEALEYYIKGLELYNQTKMKKNQAALNIKVGEVYLKKEDFKKAINHFKMSLELSQRIKSYGYIKTSSNYLVDAYANLDNYKTANQYQKIYAEAVDSLYQIDKMSEFAKLAAQQKYEQERLIQEAELQQEKNIRNLLAVVLLSLILISFIIYGYYHKNKKLVKTLNEKNSLIEKQNEELNLLNSTKDKYFSILSHDLKNPMGNILRVSESIQNTLIKRNDEELLTPVKLLYGSAVNFRNLLLNVLQWSSLQMRKTKTKTEEVDVNEVIREILNYMQERFESKEIVIENNIEKNTSVIANQQLLVSLFSNLITNAAKFSHKGGKIALSSLKKEGNEVITIEDNGIGIDESTMEKLFKMDKKISKSGTENETGTGLGLIICKDIVESFDGSISIKSEIGKGTTVSFTLPKV